MSYKNVFLKFALFAAVLSPQFCFAQSDTHGGGFDGEFKKTRDEIGVWLGKNLAIHELGKKLELTSISEQELYDRFSQAVKDVGEKLVFNYDEISFEDANGVKNIRVCKNQGATITCNIKEWKEMSASVRYMIVFHEYLGVAKIETNVNVQYSQYPISSKILPFVHTRRSAELGMNKVQKLKSVFCASSDEDAASRKLFYIVELQLDRPDPRFVVYTRPNTAYKPVKILASRQLTANDILYYSTDRYIKINEVLKINQETPVKNELDTFFVKGLLDSYMLGIGGQVILSKLHYTIKPEGLDKKLELELVLTCVNHREW